MSAATEKPVAMQGTPTSRRRGWFGGKRRDRVDNKGQAACSLPQAGVHKSCSMVNLASSNSATSNTGLKSCLSSNNLSGMGSSSTMMKRNVSFHQIEVREYERALSDHPSVRSGPAVGLSWKHNESYHVDFEKFEKQRLRERKSDFSLSQSKRERILKEECGITNVEMLRAIRDANIIKNKRRATISSPRSAHKRQEVMEAASRKMKRFLKPKKEMEKLWKDAEQYSKNKQQHSKQPESIKRVMSCNDMDKVRSTTTQVENGGLKATNKTLSQSCGNLHMMSLGDESDDPDPILLYTKPAQVNRQGSDESTDADDEDEWGFGLDEVVF